MTSQAKFDAYSFTLTWIETSALAEQIVSVNCDRQSERKSKL